MTIKKKRMRWQDIKFDANGDAYVSHYGTKYYLKEVFIDSKQEIDGTDFFTLDYGLLVTVNNDCSRAAVKSIY